MNGFVSDENREIPACSSSFFLFFFSAAFFYVAFLSTSMEKILSSLVLCFVHVCVFLMCSSITSASANNAPRGILFLSFPNVFITMSISTTTCCSSKYKIFNFQWTFPKVYSLYLTIAIEHDEWHNGAHPSLYFTLFYYINS